MENTGTDFCRVKEALSFRPKGEVFFQLLQLTALMKISPFGRDDKKLVKLTFPLRSSGKFRAPILPNQ